MDAALDKMTNEQLKELLRIYAKNTVALDGVWFQSVERTLGMDEAMRHNDEAWRRFPVSDARRLKAFLGLGDRPGLEGLAAALELKFNSLANKAEIVRDDDALVYRVVECRVQAARARKGMPLHPCKETGQCEFEAFSRTVDDRIRCECASCYPDVVDETCSCAWRFTVE